MIAADTKITAYEYAKLAHLNVFRPVQRGKRPKGVAVKGSWDGVPVEVLMWEQLCPRDQDLYLYLCHLATHQNHRKIDAVKDTELEHKGDYSKMHTCTVKASGYHLTKIIYGDNSARNYKLLWESLRRLGTTHVIFASKTNQESLTSLIGYTRNEDAVEISINPLSALLLLGDKVGYVRYNLQDRFNLPPNTARL
ncbi:MAG: RepB family plasmid replication initiator protein, partial [Verrucomicrobiales bacterium]